MKLGSSRLLRNCWQQSTFVGRYGAGCLLNTNYWSWSVQSWGSGGNNWRFEKWGEGLFYLLCIAGWYCGTVWLRWNNRLFKKTGTVNKASWIIPDVTCLSKAPIAFYFLPILDLDFLWSCRGSIFHPRNQYFSLLIEDSRSYCLS